MLNPPLVKVWRRDMCHMMAAGRRPPTPKPDGSRHDGTDDSLRSAKWLAALALLYAVRLGPSIWSCIMQPTVMTWQELKALPIDPLNSEVVHATAKDGPDKAGTGYVTFGSDSEEHDRVSHIAADMLARKEQGLEGYREDLGLISIRTIKGVKHISDGAHRARACVLAQVDGMVHDMGEASNQDVVERISAGLNHRSLSVGQRATIARELAKRSGMDADALSKRWGVSAANMGFARRLENGAPVLYDACNRGDIDLRMANFIRVKGLHVLFEREPFQTEGKRPAKSHLKAAGGVAQSIDSEVKDDCAQTVATKKGIKSILTKAVNKPAEMTIPMAIAEIKAKVALHVKAIADAKNAPDEEPEEPAAPATPPPAPTTTAQTSQSNLASVDATVDAEGDAAAAAAQITKHVAEQGKEAEGSEFGQMADTQLKQRIVSLELRVRLLNSWVADRGLLEAEASRTNSKLALAKRVLADREQREQAGQAQEEVQDAAD